MKKKYFLVPAKKCSLVKSILFTIPFILLDLNGYTQSIIKKISVRDHRGNSTAYHQRFVITSLKSTLNDGNFEKARRQWGIIGNDFFKVERIGTAYNDNALNVTDYYPIDGYKRTLCGRKINSWYGGDGDYNLLYDVTFTDPLLQKNFSKLDGLNNDYVWNYMLGENLLDADYKSYYPKMEKAEVLLRPAGCMYGAWIREVSGDFNPSSHKDYNEVHPLEQEWVIEQNFLGKNKQFWSLLLANDNSGKFDEYSDYDSRPEKLWCLDTLNGIFAFAFEINLNNKESINFLVNDICNNQVFIKNDDGKLHYLIYKNDTLVTLRENSVKEVVNINFYNVGFVNSDPEKINGFVLITSRLEQKSKNSIGQIFNKGNLQLEVIYEKKSSIKQEIKITLQKIKRLENNSFRYNDADHNELYTCPTVVPNDFNEKSVFVTFKQGRSQKSIFIPTLEKGQEYNFNDFVYNWEGRLTDEYFSGVNCTQNASPSSIGLGGVGIGGFPIRSRAESRPTMLRFDKPDLIRLNIVPPDRGNTEGTYTIVNTSLFEITYKVELLSTRVNNNP